MPRIKKKEHEKLSTSNIQHVADLLAAEKPITKKEACAILAISYNTTRLTKILNDHAENLAYKEKRKSMNKGKAAAPYEIKEATMLYLKGENVTNIAKGLYRSAGFVKTILDKLGVPTKPSSVEERVEVAYLPENCVADTFEKGELAWSAKYHSIVEVQEEQTPTHIASHKGLGECDYESKYESKVYSIYVKEQTENDFDIDGGYYAYSLAYDLGKLQHLKEHGIKLEAI